jgi:predicted RNase H-like nuclease
MGKWRMANGEWRMASIETLFSVWSVRSFWSVCSLIVLNEKTIHMPNQLERSERTARAHQRLARSCLSPFAARCSVPLQRSIYNGTDGRSVDVVRCSSERTNCGSCGGDCRLGVACRACDG